MIVLVNGCPGAGKSTICAWLAKRLKPSVHVNVDELHHWITYADLSEEQLDLSIRSAAAIAGIFHQAGYWIFVDFVFETEAQVSRFLEQLPAEFRHLVQAIHLYADLNTLRRRDGLRPPDCVMGKRVDELFIAMADYTNRRGHIIDSSNKSIDATGGNLLNCLTSRKALLFPGVDKDTGPNV